MPQPNSPPDRSAETGTDAWTERRSGRGSDVGAQRTPLYRFWQPRYWAIWVALSILYPMTLLPLRAQHATGRVLGRLGARLLPKRRQIAKINITICFPEKGPAEIDSLVRRSFESLGMGLFELCFAWWGSLSRARRMITINGEENLAAPPLSGPRCGTGVGSPGSRGDDRFGHVGLPGQAVRTVPTRPQPNDQ